MKLLHAGVSVLVLTAGLAIAKPQIADKGVRNAAAVSEPAALARGGAFYVTGEGLGPVEAAKGEVPLGTELAGVSVAVKNTGDGNTVQAYVREAAARRVVAILPSATPAGDYEVTVSANGEASDPVKVRVVDRNFGLATSGAWAGGLVPARIIADGADPVTVGFTTPLRPGQTAELLAAGLGPIDGADNDWPPQGNLVDAVVVRIGSNEVSASYAGRHPNLPGFDRVLFLVPDDVALGCGVSVFLKVGDAATVAASVPVAKGDAAACTHALGLTVEQLKALDEGGNIVMGGFDLLRQAMSATIEGMSFDMTTESAGGSFIRYNRDSLGAFLSSQDGAWYLNASGCQMWDALDTAVEAQEAVALDAGAELTLAGPSSLNKKIPRKEKNSYTVNLAEGGGGIPGLPNIPGLPSIPGLPGAGGGNVIKKGAYTLTGPGGADVGPFSVTLDVSDEIVWTNKGTTTAVDRSKDLPVLWTGGIPADLVILTGISNGPAPENAALKVTRGFVCIAPADRGNITVPTSILGRMPASAGLSETSMGALSLQQVNGPDKGRFTAPLTAGGSTASSSFSFTFGTTKTIPYQ